MCHFPLATDLITSHNSTSYATNNHAQLSVIFYLQSSCFGNKVRERRVRFSTCQHAGIHLVPSAHWRTLCFVSSSVGPGFFSVHWTNGVLELFKVDKGVKILSYYLTDFWHIPSCTPTPQLPGILNLETLNRFNSSHHVTSWVLFRFQFFRVCSFQSHIAICFSAPKVWLLFPLLFSFFSFGLMTFEKSCCFHFSHFRIR